MAKLNFLSGTQWSNANGTPHNGALANFYQTGTTTRQNTYTTSALSVAHPNPVVSDSSGIFPPIWEDESLVDYSVVVTDPLGTTLFSSDPTGVGLSAADIGQALYPQSALELAAAITPVNFQYAPGNVLRYGTNTVPGTTDMATAITNAIASGHTVVFPPGSYRVDSGVIFARDDLCVIFEDDAKIVPASSALLTPVTVGGTSNPARMSIAGLRVDRTTYDGATENIGVLWLENTQCTFVDCESRFSKYNHKFAPTTTGFDYCSVMNLQGIGGFYNFWLDPTSNGYVNENDFVGGRGFCTANTDTNFRNDAGGLGAGHNRISMSLEGQGVQAIYDNGNANQWLQCRTEGTWTHTDPSGNVAAHVYGASCLYALVLSSRIDYTIDRTAASDPRDQVISYRAGSYLNTRNNLLTTLTLENQSSSRGSGLDIFNTRQNADASAWRAIRKIASATGAHDGGDGQAVLTDSSESWTTDEFLHGIIYNHTDGSHGIISANTGTTITAPLAGGADNDWDDGDTYTVYLMNGWLNTLGQLHTRGTIQVGPTNQTYTETNVSTDRAFDANTVVIAELADVVGTLIGDLRAKGLVD